MKVLLSGATGHVGTGISESLSEAGHEVIGLARSDGSAQKLRERGLASFPGDMSDTGSVSRAIRDSGAEAVVHAAASAGDDPAADDRAFLEGVFEALSGAVLIYTSGAWVMGDTGGRLADEDDPLRPTASLSWRPSVEEFVLREGVAGGMRPVVVRPALVYGGSRGEVEGMVETARESGYVRYVARPGADAHWTLVHRKDVGCLYGRILGLEEAEKDRLLGGGLTLISTGGPPVPVEEVARAASRAAGTGGRVEPWPLEEAREELGSYAEDLALDQRLSGEKARRLLAFEPRSPYIFEELERLSRSERKEET